MVAAPNAAAAARSESRRGRRPRFGRCGMSLRRAAFVAVSAGFGNAAGTSPSRRSKSLGMEFLQLFAQCRACAAQSRDDGADRDLEVRGDLFDARIEPVVED